MCSQESDVEAPRQVQRLFLALWPDDEVRAQLAGLARHSLHKTGKRVPTENIHITLAFLGSVDAERRACVEAVAGNISAPPFVLNLDQLGYWRRPRVLWAGASQVPDPLLKLVHDLNTGLKSCGFEPENRPFQAHATLARKVTDGGPVISVDPVVWRVEGFRLIESLTLPTGAVYKEVRAWRLTG